jgi:hypothetical protein
LELQQKALPDLSRLVYLPNLTLLSPVFSRLTVNTAAASPECGGGVAGVRRRAAESSPVRPYLAAQDAKTCVRGLYTKLGSTRASLGGQEATRASTATGARRGQIGLTSEPEERLKRARKGKTGGGNFSHHVKKRRAISRAKERWQ